MRDPDRERLFSWGRAARARHLSRGLPALFLFTDARAGSPLAAIGRLPPGRAGIVFRHRHLPPRERAALLRRVRRACAARHLILCVAGPTHGVRNATHGRHRVRGRPPLSAPVHDGAELHQASRAGARIAFISPVFPSRSHLGAQPLGIVRATRLAVAARRAGLLAFALGGIDARTVRRLPSVWAGLGAIDSLTGGE